MVVCDRLLDEVRRGLDSRYFRDRLSADERKSTLAALATIGTKAADPVSPPRVVRDPNDDYLVWRSS
jgi:hypothetical protein